MKDNLDPLRDVLQRRHRLTEDEVVACTEALLRQLDLLVKFTAGEIGASEQWKEFVSVYREILYEVEDHFRTLRRRGEKW